ncbi:MAG: phosphopentomutase, partial [Clostridia bacterium]|nr:phosphopentomutase [Clostridia bacterium]
GSNTILSCSKSENFHLPHLRELGFFNIDGVTCEEKTGAPQAAFARLSEKSNGKDTTVGHWEIAGVVSEQPLPVFPNGFPAEFLEKFSAAVGRGVLCNLPYSGTKVLEDYGEEHLKTGKLIVYTSADSVFQIAAHEELVPVEELYKICETAREMLMGDLAVGRVIARPFIGGPGHFVRTAKRHDYSLSAPGETMLDRLKAAGKTVYSVGKIADIFNGRGITKAVRTKNNAEGIDAALQAMREDFTGLCFVNLVDFDMLYGHRNDVDGYAAALSYFDSRLPELLSTLREDDVLMITADHGCDPGTPSTDHSREYIPFLAYGKDVQPQNFGTLHGFDRIGAAAEKLLSGTMEDGFTL